LLSYSLDELLQEVRDRHFPDLSRKVHCWFSFESSLAHIEFHATDFAAPVECCATDFAAHIYLHSLLNHPETPRTVVEFVLTHELLHLQIRPRVVVDRRVDHPPEFWAREAELAPRRRLCWAWLRLNFGECLKRDARRERLQILPRKAKSLMAQRRIPWEHVPSIAGVKSPEGEPFVF